MKISSISGVYIAPKFAPKAAWLKAESYACTNILVMLLQTTQTYMLYGKNRAKRTCRF